MTGVAFYDDCNRQVAFVQPLFSCEYNHLLTCLCATNKSL